MVVQEWRQGGRVMVREADRVAGRITKATVEGWVCEVTVAQA